MATFTKINDWAGNMVKVANVATDQFVVALSNTAPASEGTPPTGDGAGILANVTQVAYTNLSTRNITTTSSTTTAGTMKLILADLTLTSTGGSTGPFRYVYIYDDTPTSPVDPLVMYYDYGTSITLNATETLLIDFDGTNGFFTVA